jgi:hypothetical protein
MDAEEAEGIGREHLEWWPRDRVILGSLYSYRPLSARQPGSVGLWDLRGPQISLGALFISNDGHRSALSAPSASPSILPRRAWSLCRDQ